MAKAFSPARDEYELAFRPDPHIGDGQYANNAWLQELPRPFTKLSWSNAALFSPADAVREQIANGDLVEISVEHRLIQIPAWILPGQCEGVITLHLGYGRRRAGRHGSGRGVDVTPLQTAESPWHGTGCWRALPIRSR